MSARRPWPCWLLPALLCGGAGGYVVVSSVSWPLPEAGAAADELHSSSTEEALPALLEEAGGLWKQSYPASAYREDAALGAGPAARRPGQGQGAAPSRMFSYRREGGAAPGRAGTARFLARHNTWGFVATRAARGKIQGMPYGNCLLLSDGPINNSTGIPFFYVTPKDNTVTDLLKNPMASLTLPEADGNFCRVQLKKCRCYCQWREANRLASHNTLRKLFPNFFSLQLGRSRGIRAVISHMAMRNVFRGHMCILPGRMEGLVSSGGEGCQLLCGKRSLGKKKKRRKVKDSSA
ncbi:protein CREG2 isoform X1 [Molothrus aeneus]|uniref:protein CREG2 isoform X1 n=1 Tax=Molothrus aeneus TaxID=84833 RepID=UPI0034583BB4